MSASGTKVVASILVADRPGIMRDLTGAIAGLGGNIDGISQTVVEGYFSVILTAAFPRELEPGAVQAAITEAFPPGEADIVVRPFLPVVRAATLAGGARYFLVISGADRPGILKRATTCLAARGVNIEDWSCQTSGPQVHYIALLTVPRAVRIGDLQRELRRMLAEMDLRCSLQHENIFRATNEVGPITRLIKEADDAARP